MLSAKEVDTVLDERKLAVLRAIVEDYVSTTEPVGSKSLVDRHGLDVSPATIRNDMAVLEEQGFIAQPHTSAGRIPTDKGYRLFVDRLSSVKPMSAAERRAIETFLAGAYSLDEVVARTVRLLADEFEVFHPEKRLVLGHMPAHEHLEGGVRALVLVAGELHLLQFLREARDLRRVAADAGEEELYPLRQRASAGHLGQ